MKQNFPLYLKVFAAFGLCLVSTGVAASIFNVVPTDQSMQYLGTLFGGSIGTISLGGGANPLLNNMFESFNFIVVTAGVIILSWVGVAAAINTAREGEAMGKKFSLWVPLKGLVGMLIMLPTPGTGYSVIQMTVMWLVLNGIGAANTIWGVVLNQLATGTQAVGAIQIPLNNLQLKTLAENVLSAATCASTLNLLATQGQLPGLQAAGGPIRTFAVQGNITTNGTNPPTTLTQMATVYVGIPNSQYNTICGSFNITSSITNTPTNIEPFTMGTIQNHTTVKINALQAMFTTLSPLAQTLSIPAPTDPLAPAPQPPAPGYSAAAGTAYSNVLAALAGTAVQSQAQAVAVQQQQQLVQDLQAYGWIAAASYYFALSTSTISTISPDALVLPSANAIPQYTGADWSSSQAAPTSASSPLVSGKWSPYLFNALQNSTNRSQMDVALQSVVTYWTTDSLYTPNPLPVFASSTSSTGNSTLDTLMNDITQDIRNPILNYFMGVVGSQTGDPLQNIGAFGWQLMAAGEAAILFAVFTSFVLSLALSAMCCLSPFAAAANQLLGQAFAIIYGFVALMWTVGATLGIYIPLIPYIVFTVTAFGWFIAVAEAIVGAPIIAIGLIQPAGDELGNLRKPLGILANIFFRPTFMIFGFILGAGLVRALLNMINFGFLTALNQAMNPIMMPSLFAIIPEMMTYGFLVIVAVNQAFSLIYVLPNKVLRFGGVDPDQYEAGQVVQEVKGGFEAGRGVAQEGVSAGVTKGQELGQAGAARLGGFPTNSGGGGGG